MWEIHEEARSMKKQGSRGSLARGIVRAVSAEKEVPKGLRILDSH